MSKQSTALYEAMDNMRFETTENRRRFIHNSRTKDVENLQSYDNKVFLEVVSLTNELLRKWEMEEKVDLEIHYARYGSSVHKRDVIEAIEQQMSPHQRLNLLINNDNLSGDFYPGEEKQLHIIYTFNGMLYEEKLSEGEILSIPKLLIEARKTNTLLDSANIVLIILFLILGVSLIFKRPE